MKNKNLIYAGIAMVICYLCYSNYAQISDWLNGAMATAGSDNGNNSDNGSNASSTGSSASGGSTGGSSSLDYTKILKSGSKGPEVVELQKAINAVGYTPPLVTDGIFGIKTNNALKLYNNGSASITLAEVYAKLYKAVGN